MTWASTTDAFSVIPTGPEPPRFTTPEPAQCAGAVIASPRSSEGSSWKEFPYRDHRKFHGGVESLGGLLWIIVDYFFMEIPHREMGLLYIIVD